jgi:hypothetical protein
MASSVAIRRPLGSAGRFSQIERSDSLRKGATKALVSTLTGMGYNGKVELTDQVPQRAIDAGFN